VVTLRIGRDQFFQLITEFPTIAIEVMRVLAKRVLHTTELLSRSKAACVPPPEAG